MIANSNSFTHDDSNLIEPGNWYARVMAVDEYGKKSAYSKTGMAVIKNPYITPPTSVRIEASGNKVNLKWASCNTVGYVIYNSKSGKEGSFSRLSVATSTHYEAKLNNNLGKYFYITGVDNQGNESEPSEIVTIKSGVRVPKSASVKGDVDYVFGGYLPQSYLKLF